MQGPTNSNPSWRRSFAYEYHRTVLQVLQSGGRRGVWTLKSPNHAIALEALTSVYPDARLILLHREPTVLCAPACSLISTLTGTFGDADHSAYIAEHWTRLLELFIERIEEFRLNASEHTGIDSRISGCTPLACANALPNTSSATTSQPRQAASEPGPGRHRHPGSGRLA